MIGPNDPSGSTASNRMLSPYASHANARPRRSKVRFTVIGALSLFCASGVASRQSVSAQTIPVATNPIPVATNPTGVSAPGPTNVTSQIVDTNQVASLIANNDSATIAGPPPTNSSGVVVTPVAPTVVARTPNLAPPTTAKRRSKTSVTTTTATTAITSSATSATSAAPVTDNASTGAIPDSAWAALRKCESDANYRANTGNGYYGAYQFAVGTWRKLGYTGFPHEASPAIQDEAARRLQAKSGWGQWPACTRKLGLR